MTRAAFALAVLGCGRAGPGDAATYREALDLAARDPAAAWERCRALILDGLRDDCDLVAVEAWATGGSEPTDALLARCATLGGETARAECAFQVAERRDHAAACAAAGPFADDCRLHLFTLGLDRWIPRGATPADPALHAELVVQMRRVGLPAGDLRPASAFFRAVLDQQPVLDRGACQALVPGWREACWNTGEAVYGDRLNRARDQGALPCAGDPLPPTLAHADDAALDAALAARQREAGCPGPAPTAARE